MPLTFAHPAIAIPFAHTRSLHFTAFVIGTMAPDFEYFLRGYPFGTIGHTWFGMLWLNLPLCFITYVVWQYIQPTLYHYCAIANTTLPFTMTFFVRSALLGMITHILWDSFTHRSGFFVTHFSLLRMPLYFPLYKWLQHGSTAVGLMIIGYFLWRQITWVLHDTTQAILQFWLCYVGLIGCCMFVWYMVDSVPLHAYGTHVVRFIDSSILALVITCLYARTKV